MVNILHHHPKGDVVDAPALEQFQKDWTLYRTLVEHDALFHRAVADHLHDALATAFDRPFSLVDLACGDAFVVRGALEGTRVAHYHGVDLSMPALELASRTLEGAPFEVVLDHADFVEAVTARDTHADAFWFGLSLHHLETAGKRALMTAIRRAIAPDGVFLVYEPTMRPDEDRPAYLARFDAVNRPLWRAILSEEQWRAIDASSRLRPAGDGGRLEAPWPRGRLLARLRDLRRPDRPLPDVPLRPVSPSRVTVRASTPAAGR